MTAPEIDTNLDPRFIFPLAGKHIYYSPPSANETIVAKPHQAPAQPQP